MNKQPSDEMGVAAAGCAIGIGSALFTCLLLYLNGSLVLAVISALNKTGDSWLKDESLAQCVLFLVPVVLVVIEWMMIDYVRTRFVRRAR
jgi:hypothetical protein